MSHSFREIGKTSRSFRATFATATPRHYAQKPPRPLPEPRAYKPSKTSAPEPKTKQELETSEPTERVSAFSFLWPFGKTKPAPAPAPAPQPEAPQVNAAENGETPAPAPRVVDRKDPLYSATARNWISIICGSTLVIGLSWPLYERLVLGVEQKKSLATHKEEQEKAAGDGVLAKADSESAG